VKDDKQFNNHIVVIYSGNEFIIELMDSFWIRVIEIATKAVKPINDRALQVA
jgi:hypothetical protein